MHYWRQSAWVAAAILLSLGAGGPATTDADPWRGKPREEILSLLGRPDKSKSRSGKESLTYKLFRLDDESALAPGLLVADVPGVGVVGRFERAPAVRGDELKYQPTDFDEDGRPIPGGFREEQTASVSWDSETGKAKRDEDLEIPGDSARGGRLTIKFHLDADGRVESWSVSPKKQARQQ